ncbi:hypothetical protein [Streptomyces roseoverticillatus]|uniref:Uncharacterized protein n=1 Tax=Streptomyces roseoverticillatus TaxID=66429 RepID=A0ABV3J6Y7_9ACTN
MYRTGKIPDWDKDLPGVTELVDSSTGVVKVPERTCIPSRNNSIRAELLEGDILDATSESDRWAM